MSTRSTGTVAVIGMMGSLLSLPAGCMTAVMSAPRGRAPVLLGPVPCIGCAPVPAAPPSDAPAPFRASTTQFSNAGFSPGPGVAAPGAGPGGRYSDLDLKADAAAIDPCRGEVRLSRVRASSFGSLFRLSVGVHIEGSPVWLARGNCVTAFATSAARSSP